MPNPIRDDIERKVADLVMGVRQRVRGNTDGLFAEAYAWQVIEKISKDEAKKAEQALRDNELIDEDDDIRALGHGEHTIESSNSFSMQALVKKTSGRFDKDKFILAASRKFRIAVEKLTALAESDKSKKETKAPLEKWIVEL